MVGTIPWAKTYGCFLISMDHLRASQREACWGIRLCMIMECLGMGVVVGVDLGAVAVVVNIAGMNLV